ncbi:MAG: iron ABC transporter ATP-binding protein [Desulfurococcales archaeon ex4484_217_1]|nr:MAG: iron ABC transporter ATP-binding protein [Desulfurococcales archaeon ex4484_217_1]
MVKIKILNLSFSYDSIEALENVSIEFKEGEVVSIIGPNGAGKTTLLKCIAKLLKPKKGVIYLDGRDIWSISNKDLAKILTHSLFEVPKGFNLTVLDFLLTSRYPHFRGFWETKKDLDVVEEALTMVNARCLAERRLEELSDGELQRIVMAKLIAHQAKVLLVDEPTVHLDLKYQLEILNMLRRISKINNTLTIMTLHDLRLASIFSDKLVLLHRGKIVATGTPPEVLTEENIAKTYGVEVEIINHSKAGIIIVPLNTLSQI